MISDEFLCKIPKTDLHVHLDGSLRIGTLIELAQQQGTARPSESSLNVNNPCFAGVWLPSYDESVLLETVFKESYDNLEVSHAI